MRKVLPFLLLAAALPLLASEANTVSAQGYACFLVLPDAATVNLNVNVWSKDISDLHKKSDESLAKLSRELAKAGLKEPLREYGFASMTPEVYSEEVEYRLRLNVIMIVDDLSIIDDLLGVLPTHVLRDSDASMVASPSTIQYTIKDPSPYVNDLRKKALEDARAKADELAAIQGKSLGNLVDFGEAELSVGSRTFQSFGVVNFEAEDKVVRSPLPRLLMECKVTATYELVE